MQLLYSPKIQLFLFFRYDRFFRFKICYYPRLIENFFKSFMLKTERVYIFLLRGYASKMQRRSREHRDPSEGDLEAGGRKRIGENRSIGIREIMIGRRYLQNWRQRRARSLREVGKYSGVQCSCSVLKLP